MKRGLTLVLALAVLVALAGCAGSDNPKQVSQNFWDAVVDGDAEEAKAYMTKASAESVEVNDSAPGEGEVTLGAESIDGDRATVATTLVSLEDGGEMTIQLQTVLVREDNAWKVDFDQTMMSMFGGAMGAMMEEMGKAMQDTMGEMSEEMAKEMAKQMASGSN